MRGIETLFASVVHYTIIHKYRRLRHKCSSNPIDVYMGMGHKPPEVVTAKHIRRLATGN
jgi:hypothetical protein